MSKLSQKILVILEQKLVQTGLVSVSNRFFWFQVYKTEPVSFLKILINLISFFHGSVFSIIFF
jgi:hypothetical protein